MRLKTLELSGFKSFAKKTVLEFSHPVVAIVGPNGSGKSNIVEAFRFVLGEQSIKSMRGKQGSDLIFAGSKFLPKSNKASVFANFDNLDKTFKLINNEGENIYLDYENIVFGREVFTDGLNKYSLNNEDIRLKDINALLASVNIGANGHHIISQGEADRVLNTSPRERKEIIEEALGLRVYQYKIKETEKKLMKAKSNIDQANLLRKENAPHLSFLKRQLDKFEKSKQMKEDLFSLYLIYLKKESLYLEREREIIFSKKDSLLKELEIVKNKLSSKNNNSFIENSKVSTLKDLEDKISINRREKNELERKLGRVEGMIDSFKIKKENISYNISITNEELNVFISDVSLLIEDALSKDSLQDLKTILYALKEKINSLSNKDEKDLDFSQEINNLVFEMDKISLQIKEIEQAEIQLNELIKSLKNEINLDLEKEKDKEKEYYSFQIKQQELVSEINLLSVKEETLLKEEESFQNEIREGSVLIGVRVLQYKDFSLVPEEDLFNRNIQYELKRQIERIKIKLEDIGVANESDITKEYNDAKQRDEFLQKEIEDLNNSIVSLNKLILELKDTIEINFKTGIEKINEQFKYFFGLMFNGGFGKLNIVLENKKNIKDEFEDTYTEDNIIFEQGVEINVSLPTKKVKELNALSGGERSLTSIALLFAISQVNPPPFLVLDETDAALDEANSRKYGDMIERLSEKSQLIVVTHNRETMSRAGVLYGVTIGADGASKVLSVRFEEAQAIAK